MHVLSSLDSIQRKGLRGELMTRHGTCSMALPRAQCMQYRDRTQVGRRHAAGQQIVAGGEVQTRCATSGAQGASRATLRCGATVRAASSQAARPERDARKQLNVARGTATSQAARKGQRRAWQHPVTPTETASKALRDYGRSGNQVLPAENHENGLKNKLGVLHDHFGVSRRGATVRAAT